MSDRRSTSKYHLNDKKKYSKYPHTDWMHPDYNRRLLAYTNNLIEGTVSVVDILRSRRITDITVGRDPFDLVLSPDQRYLYVTNEADDTVSVIRTSDNRVVDTIKLNTGTFTGRAPSGVRVSPDGRFVYTANFESSNLSVIDAAERRVITTIQVPPPSDPDLLVITRDGLLAYVTLLFTKQVAVVDLSANLFLKTIPVGDLPECIAISPTDPLAFVVNEGSASITAINTELAQPSPNNIPVGLDPFGVAFNPSGRRAYVTSNPQNNSNLTVIDVFTHTPLFNIPLDPGDLASGLQVTRDGRFIVVANFGSNTVSIIDARTNKVLSKVPVGDGPQFVAILDTCKDNY